MKYHGDKPRSFAVLAAVKQTQAGFEYSLTRLLDVLDRVGLLVIARGALVCRIVGAIVTLVFAILSFLRR